MDFNWADVGHAAEILVLVKMALQVSSEPVRLCSLTSVFPESSVQEWIPVNSKTAMANGSNAHPVLPGENELLDMTGGFKVKKAGREL
jgi:hypothetical protein